jgi:hypothetical protein
MGISPRDFETQLARVRAGNFGTRKEGKLWVEVVRYARNLATSHRAGLFPLHKEVFARP